MVDEFARRLLRAYDGEVFGEALFTHLAEQRTEPDEARALGRLSVLEQKMGEAIAALADGCGITIPDATTSAVSGREAAATLAAEAWTTFLAEFDEGTRRALEGYRRLRAAAPDPDDPVLIALTDHEEALRAFAARCLSGGAGALELVDAVIHRLDALQGSGSGESS
jgi:hypothetical protein